MPCRVSFQELHDATFIFFFNYHFECPYEGRQRSSLFRSHHQTLLCWPWNENIPISFQVKNGGSIRLSWKETRESSKGVKVGRTCREIHSENYSFVLNDKEEEENLFSGQNNQKNTKNTKFIHLF